MLKYLFAILSTILLATSCTKQDNFSQPYSEGLSAVERNDTSKALKLFNLAIATEDHPLESHLQLGSLCANNVDLLPLAIWHFSQVEKLTTSESQRINAQMRRESAEKKYLLSLQAAWATTEALDAKLQLQLLKEQNKKLNDQLSRINRENATLRQMAASKK